MKERLNAICPYFAMFPLDYPMDIIQRDNPAAVLDPFCGRGTTNLAARVNGVYSVGVDSSRVAYSIAASKMVSVTPEEICSECTELLDGPEPSDVPQGEFWDLMYKHDVLVDICKIREALLDDCSSPERTALRGIVMGALHGPLRAGGGSSYLSNQFPRTYASKPGYSVRFWKSKGYEHPPEVSVKEIVSVRARRYYSDDYGCPRGFILNKDSTRADTFREIESLTEGRKFDAVITSPPYLKMYTYIPDQWIRNWFVGGPEYVEYSLKDQIHDGADMFTEQLRSVWRNCASICKDGASLHIRFGKIGSDNNDPWSIIRDSLEGTGWKPMGMSEAGLPSKGKRQSDSFLKSNKNSYREIDVSAVLV